MRQLATKTQLANNHLAVYIFIYANNKERYMRLVSFIHIDNPKQIHWGIWYDDYVLDVQIARPSLPSSLRLAIEQSNEVVPALKEIFATQDSMDVAKIPFNKVKLQAPYLDPPRNILCTGINYAEHLDELVRPLSVEQKLPEYPFIFTKPRTAIAHPEAAVECHANITDSYDYEVELAVIIGKKGRDISKEAALDYVFGYSIMNDLSARNIQRRTSQWYCGKALDGSAPLGPCVVLKDYIKNPQDLRITSRINGETRQDSNTKNMLFDVATLIHIVSQGTSILPGDIIATGTPSGVGMSFNPPKYLKPGDVMELEIQDIGVLRNSLI